MLVTSTLVRYTDRCKEKGDDFNQTVKPFPLPTLVRYTDECKEKMGDFNQTVRDRTCIILPMLATYMYILVRK